MTAATPDASPAPTLLVRKQVTVKAPPAQAFKVFTEMHGAWWPLETHHIGAADAATAVIEPRVGGRWFERGVDGSECDWGRVLAWEPPGRLVLSWQIGADWRFDPALLTEVEILFEPVADGQTRLTLEHRHLEAYGEGGPAMQGILGSEGGWTGILALFAGAMGGDGRA